MCCHLRAGLVFMMKTDARTLIKICGMTREADAQAAVSMGADAIGMLFYDKSPRFVENTQAASIARAVGDKALKVGLFVDAPLEQVRSVLTDVPLDILQFHGNESLEFCMGFGRPFWKTIRVKEREDLIEQVKGFQEAAGILLDTWHPTQAGGTGHTFDWSATENLVIDQHLILAGGLNPDNVASAIEQVRPWAVDVASGVEESPGIKSEHLMKQFIDEVNRVSTETP